MKTAIHQPDFLPWIGFFHKWAISDLFIIYDDAQYIKHGWQNRDKIKINDSDQWITIPVLTKGKSEQSISEVEIDNRNRWNHKILNTFKTFFRRTKNFHSYFPEIEKILLKDHNLLIDLNMELIYWVGEKLKIDVPIKFSSEYKIELNKTEKLLGLMKKINADEYYTGIASKDYLDENLLKENRIKIVYQNFDEIVNYYNISRENVGYSIIQYLFQEHNQ